MENASGVGGEGTPIQPSEIKGTEPTGEPGSAGSIEKALHTPVRSLGQLKQVLVENLGEKEGTKLYNNFMKSFMMQILNQVQESAAQAKRAAHNMRSPSQG